MTASDPTTTASLLALALGVVKVIEALVTWVVKRYMPGSQTQQQVVVQLAPDVSGQIRDMHQVVSKTNNEGSPLVYGPRTEIHELVAAAASTSEKLDDIEEKTAESLLILRKVPK